MLNFKVNGKCLTKFRYFMWRHRTMYLLFLEDIDIVTETGMVYPYYRPLFYTERHPGQWILCVSAGEKVLTFIFQSRAPYFTFEIEDVARSYTEVIRERDDED